jgi:hypothetical protein
MAVTTNNTLCNIGICLDSPGLGMRNFESGRQYKSRRENLEYAGSLYDTDESITFDGTLVYKDEALMERYWNAGLLTPIET